MNRAHEPKLATFAAGCFWAVEETFSGLKGVVKTTAGYTGGHVEKPSYEDVCTGRTGHAEAVLVEYDPSVIAYAQLLTAFFSGHDPTTLNRQGPDVGEQYRSVIFYHDLAQKIAAEEAKRALIQSGTHEGKAVVTEIVPAQPFYKAEEYHQKYLSKRRFGGGKR